MSRTHRATSLDVLFITLALTSACTKEGDTTPGTCQSDWQCKVGEVCNGATAEQEGTCAAAGATDERNFGEVELSFATGDEVYLLSVFSLPGAKEASAAAPAAFTLSEVSEANGGALRLAPIVGDRVDASADPFWRDRLAFEAARRDGIKKLARAPREVLASALERSPGRAPACTACGSDEVCWKGECTSAPQLTFVNGSSITCEVVGRVSEGSLNIDILRDLDTTATPAALTAAVEELAEAAAEVLYLWGQDGGHTGALDHDESGAMTVVFSDALADLQDGNIVGAFFYGDMLAAGAANATGNEADLLWARPPGDETIASCQPDGCDDAITFELTVATLAHEYSHLVNFALRAQGGDPQQLQEVTWLDEGTAHLVEDLTGWGASNLAAAAVALQNWPNATFANPNDSVEQRGMSYLLLRHLVDRKAKQAGATSATSQQVRQAAREIMVPLLDGQKWGFQHPVFQAARPDGFADWLLAVYATGNTEALQSAHRADYLPLGSAATGQPKGFNPYGDIVTARGAELTLAGPTLGDGSTDELDDFSSPFESEISESAALYFLVRATSPGTVKVGGEANAHVDLHVRAERVQ